MFCHIQQIYNWNLKNKSLSTFDLKHSIDRTMQIEYRMLTQEVHHLATFF